MAQAIKAQLHGLEDVRERLKTIKRSAGNKFVRQGITKATREMTKEVKSRTPKMSGLAHKSLGQRVKTYRGGSAIVGIVGPRTGFKKKVAIGLTGKGAKAAIVGTKGAGSLARRSSRTTERMQNPIKYFHIIERGRKAVHAKKGRALSTGVAILGRRAAAAAGRHPLQRSWQAKGAAAAETVREAVENGIAKLAAKGK